MAEPEITYESYVHLIGQLDELVQIFENHPDDATREQALTLLTGLDMLHHEGLGRMMAFLRNHGAAEYLEFALQDPIIRTLFGLYGLADLQLPEENDTAPAAVPLVQLTMNGRKPSADWVEIARTEDLPRGAVLVVDAEEQSILLVNPGEEIYAFRNVSPATGLPLVAARLDGTELICSGGERYDARTGHGTGGSAGRLTVYPVAVRGASVQLARQRSQTRNVKEVS